MINKQIYSIELNETQYHCLEQLVEKYSLPDVSKAVRCLVDYVRDEPDKEENVFEQIRCLDC